MADSSRCPTNFLADDDIGPLSPAHETVLHDVARVLESTRGGRTVALIGSYGSGKTTLVRKLRERFHLKPSAVHIFLFDAWAHRADTLRRGFIGRLARFLRERGLIDVATETDVEREITRKADVTVTRNSPRSPIGAALFALAGLAMPLLSLWLRDRVPHLNPEPWLVLCAAALFVAAFVAAPLRVFAPVAWTVAQSETSRAADLTSREFQLAFAKAISAALKPHPSAKLICVLDDLDRLNPGDVDEIVTALRIFQGSISTRVSAPY